MISKKTLTGLFLAAAAAVLASACGDSGTTGSGGAGGDGSTNSSTKASTSSTSSSSSSTSSSSTSSSTTSSSSGGMGACNNPGDLMKLMDQNLDKMTAQQCGMMCIGQPPAMQSACAKMCFQGKIMVSDPCGTCWGDVVACGIQMCLTECLMGQMQCDACTAAKCQPAFKTCSGLP